MGVDNDCDSFLQHVVSKLMSDKSLYDLVHTKLLVPGLVAELPKEDLVVPIMRALENLVNLEGCLPRLQTLLDHV